MQNSPIAGINNAVSQGVNNLFHPTTTPYTPTPNVNYSPAPTAPAYLAPLAVLPKAPMTPAGPTGVANSTLATDTYTAQKAGYDTLQGSVDTHATNKALAQPNVSVVDLLSSHGQASDFGSRAKLALEAGINNYTGTASQNNQLMGYINSKGSTTGTTTTTTDATGAQNKTTTTPEPAFTPPSTGSPGDAYSQNLLDVQNEIGNALTDRNNQVKQIMNGTFPLTASQQSSLDATKAKFDEIAHLQMIANKSYEGGTALALNREGLNLSNPREYLAEKNKAVTDGLAKISSLDATATKTMADLTQSFMDKDYAMINDNYNALQKTLEQKADALSKLQDRTDKLFTDTRDYNEKVREFNTQQQLEREKIKAASGGDESISGQAQMLVNGKLSPGELSKRGATYGAILNAANAISMATTGKPFDISKADRDYKFAIRPQTQDTLNYLKSLVGTSDANGKFVGGNLQELENISNSINRSKFPGLNDVQKWTSLATGDASYAQFQAVATEVADQVAKILQGGGSGGTSDAKLQQAANLFKTGFNKEQLKGVITSLRPLLANRAKSMIGDNPYLSDYSEDLGFTSPVNNNDFYNSIPTTTSSTPVNTIYQPDQGFIIPQ